MQVRELDEAERGHEMLVLLAGSGRASCTPLRKIAAPFGGDQSNAGARSARVSGPRYPMRSARRASHTSPVATALRDHETPHEQECALPTEAAGGPRGRPPAGRCAAGAAAVAR